MTDEIDRANERADTQLHDALTAQARRACQGLGAESATHCVDCDGPIAQAQRLALPGVQRCVYCAAALERQRRKW